MSRILLFGASSFFALAKSDFFDWLSKINEVLKNLFKKISDYEFSELLNIDHFTDYIDFILLTVLIFCALKYLRHRRAGRMFVGIAILLVMYILSILFNLHTVAFVLQCFYKAGIVVLIILFSQEIRRGLEKLGTLPEYIVNARYHKGGKEVKIERLMEAITAISLSEKMGALIVIEGYTKLDDHIEKQKGHNTIINAEISAELLKTIFMNGTELHDGGMIIRKGRVYAASCYFPPTKNLEYVNRINLMTGHPLGSRHQAAIGLSEECDAIVIVVSEETHAMSVAYKGAIYMDLTTDQLTDVVRAALTGSGRDVERIIKRIEKVKVH